ncbi:hypothetical protein [Jannaschia formosa]|uniref:hypothetical protein n=1 Tax=Jannaschia formosa TaxID=2259592 RepID=UPI000E1BA616|nr:hypothetical protein [Jannaschia formosa]TFL19533.1 hypothetical protein DR046_03225 [Jannaschia formosa]
MTQGSISRGDAIRKGPATAGALLGAALLLTGAAAAQGQDPDRVTLVFDNGLDGGNISGTLREYDGARFLLDAGIGLVAIPADGVSCIGAACPEATRPDSGSPTLVLTSLDGRSTVIGNLTEFADGVYVLATDAGEVRIPSDLVLCEGPACVEPAAAGFAGGPATLSRGDMAIEGMLVSVEDGTYVLDVVGFGELRVLVSEYECEGPGCP